MFIVCLTYFNNAKSPDVKPGIAMKRMEKPARTASNVSEVERPNPETNPESNPLFIVLLISTMPIGPGGIETTNPRIIPLSSISIAGPSFEIIRSKYMKFICLKNGICF